MTPVIYFGPLAFIPLILIGLLLDLFVFRNVTGLGLMFFTLLGLIIYIISFVMSVKVLKTEKKAQEMTLKIMKKEHLATAEEIEMSKKLFQLYNIEYINNMIIALLELVYRVLQIIAYFREQSSVERLSYFAWLRRNISSFSVNPKGTGRCDFTHICQCPFMIYASSATFFFLFLKNLTSTIAITATSTTPLVMSISRNSFVMLDILPASGSGTV